MSPHRLCFVRRFEVLRPYVVQVWFDDGSEQTIDLEAVLEGELYGPLRDPALFGAVALDPESHTLVWPNGADFDPATLYDWPRHAEAFALRASEWRRAARRA